MGVVTRCSTSAGVAPGMPTKTSTMGTMIWGSSSRGSFQTAKAPAAREAAMKRGVSLEWIQAAARRPAMPRGFVGALIWTPQWGRRR